MKNEIFMEMIEKKQKVYDENQKMTQIQIWGGFTILSICLAIIILAIIMG